LVGHKEKLPATLKLCFLDS